MPSSASEQHSTCTPRFLSGTVILYTNKLLIAFQVLTLCSVQLRAVEVEMLANLLSRSIQDHRRTAPWPLAPRTVHVATEASGEGELVCISVMVITLFSFTLTKSVHDLSVQPMRVEGCLHY